MAEMIGKTKDKAYSELAKQYSQRLEARFATCFFYLVAEKPFEFNPSALLWPFLRPFLPELIKTIEVFFR